MANEFVQTMADARIDAQSLSEFVFKPTGFKVARRLAPPIDTLQFYIDKLDTIPTIINDAINNTAVEGGVLADTFVTVTENGAGTVPRNLRDVLSFTTDVNRYGNFAANPPSVLQLAIDSVSAAGGGIIDVPAGVFDFSTGGVVLKEGVHIRCAGSGVTIFDQGEWEGSLIKSIAPELNSLTLTNDLSIGDISNEIANTCKAGDLVRYYSQLYFTRRWTDAVIREGYKEAEIVEVHEASSGEIKFKKPVFIDCKLTDTPNVVYYTPTRGMKVTGVTLKKSSAVINNSVGLFWDGAADCWYDDIKTIGYDDRGINVSRSIRVNGGTTQHIGGSDSLALCYGVAWIGGTRECHQTLVIGTECRHVVSGTGYWAISAYVVVDQIIATKGKSGALDTHAGTAYFTYKSAIVDFVGGMSGLGHKMLNVDARTEASNFLNTGLFINEGGIDLFCDNIKMVNNGRIFSTYPIINSTFNKINMQSDTFSKLQFSGGDGTSTGNTFNDIKLICPKASNATTTAEADSCHNSATTRGMFQLTSANCTVNNLVIEGFPAAVVTAFPNITYNNVTAINCGWADTLNSGNLVTLRGAESKLIDFELINDNTNLDWSTGFVLRIAAPNITLRGLSNSKSDILATPNSDFNSSAEATGLNVSDVRIKANIKYSYLAHPADAVFNNTDLIPPALRKGTTAQRPIGISDGFVYVDTTLNKLVTRIGSNWVDSTGAIV